MAEVKTFWVHDEAHATLMRKYLAEQGDTTSRVMVNDAVQSGIAHEVWLQEPYGVYPKGSNGK